MIEEIKRYTVITGASSGIGYAAAKAFAERGKNLIIAARRKERLEILKQEILEKYSKLDVIIKAVDLAILENVYRLYEDLKEYTLETWINNAGFGNYDSIANQNLEKVKVMLRLNIEAMTIFSSLFVHDYKDAEGTQLINISSCGGYTIVPAAVTYCASKFFVSSFTEGLAHELKSSNSKLQAKVLAPAATKTEFGKIANNTTEYEYDKAFQRYHTSQQVAAFLLELYDSNMTVGIVDRETFEFKLIDRFFNYAGLSEYNQTPIFEN